MKCPYCEKDGVKPPKRNEPRPHGHCPNCGRKPRATVANVDGLMTVIGYSAENRQRVDRTYIKSRTYQLRLSEQDEKDISDGFMAVRLVDGKSGKRLALVLVL